jgi:uncharacterized membrane protein YpjA
MKPHTLAIILVKLYGLWSIILGIGNLFSMCGRIVLAIYLHQQQPGETASSLSTYCAQIAANSIPATVWELALGVFLLLKAAYVVQKLFRFSAEESVT